MPNHKGNEELRAVVAVPVWRSRKAAKRMWFLTWVVKKELEFPGGGEEERMGGAWRRARSSVWPR